MSDTKTKILDLAGLLTQERGFSGFSYLDLAAQVGIKAASIHYYFKGKEDLAVALVERTREMHAKSFQELDQTLSSPRKRLEAVIEYFQGYVRKKRFCLCGMMAAELHSIGPRVSALLGAYFTDFETWLAAQFKAMGHSNPKLQATRFLSSLEGTLLLARLRDDPKLLHESLKGFLRS